RELTNAAAPLGGKDAAAYAEFLKTKSEAARHRTVELPLRMAELAAEVAGVCADAADAAGPRRAVGMDARAGAVYAEAAARVASMLVRANGGGDAAEPSVAAAERASRRAPASDE